MPEGNTTTAAKTTTNSTATNTTTTAATGPTVTPSVKTAKFVTTSSTIKACRPHC
ncbi:hypothetical protein BDN70DRAFT_939754 [Pholiota conissans]|uniref:Uncharacterized protein n=1 Tax=Pholiota conissans TaxID=109636 RepID=A0A9P6CL90_9AGAR|nr:hypothetical protein BDN70DRAFT_939754 [Pholiota conissans]